MTQEELLTMIREKDKHAFTRLYDWYAPSLWAVIANAVGPDRAESVLRETFVDVWKNIGHYDESDGRLFTWMLIRARHAAVQAIHNGHHQPPKQPTDSFVRLLDHTPRATHAIEVIGVREFVKKMRPKCIQMIELLFFRGYSPEQTADALAVPRDAVKLQNRNCVTDLRQSLLH